MITFKIAVTKINKEKLFKGEKETYLNGVLIETPNSEYGDYMIVEEVSKEERAQGIKGTILGNAKIIKPKVEQTSAQVAPQAIDDLPF